jgi:hypothetical protein
MAYRFLPPFFFPPLAVFFAITLIPPFTRGLSREDSHRIAAPRPSGRRPALSASSASLKAATFVCGSVCIKKKGVSALDTPGPAGGS